MTQNTFNNEAENQPK